ncbi:MAG: hypothetical protein SFU98_06995 [Leptospiraceae bacterium]|nr:hypothetical protein [Leptospiraceae bacterium]
MYVRQRNEYNSGISYRLTASYIFAFLLSHKINPEMKSYDVYGEYFLSTLSSNNVSIYMVEFNKEHMYKYLDGKFIEVSLEPYYLNFIVNSDLYKIDTIGYPQYPDENGSETIFIYRSYFLRKYFFVKYKIQYDFDFKTYLKIWLHYFQKKLPAESNYDISTCQHSHPWHHLPSKDNCWENFQNLVLKNRRNYEILLNKLTKKESQ